MVPYTDLNLARVLVAPVNGGLIPITLSEQGGVVHWHTDFNLKPFEFT
jgi:hypothetical protein